MTFALRPYQQQAVGSMRAEIRSGVRRVMLYCPTAGGKTEQSIELIRLAREKGRRSLFVAHRIGLVTQAWRRLRKSGIDAGVIQGDNTRGLDKPVVVGSIQTLARRGYPEFDLLIIDEAHHVAGSGEYLALLAASAGKTVIGLSATPFAKGLGRYVPELGGPLFGAMVKAATIRELIDLGFLVDCDVYGPGEPDLRGVKIVAGDYHEGQLGAAVDQPQLIGDIVATWLRLAEGKPTVCFATNVAHSKHIVAQFVAAGVAAEHIDAYTDDSDRDAVLGRLERGETLVVSNVGILTEGWDFPGCSVMILARPTKSLALYVQMAGRVLRPADGKRKATILDHSGTCKRLGFPTDDLPLELDDGTKKPQEKEAAKRNEKLPVACPSCSFMLPPKSRVCPQCGEEIKRANKVEAADGELVKLKRGKVASADQSQVYAELIGYARSKGRQDSWAKGKFKEIFGGWPSREVDAATPSPETMRLIRYVNIRRMKSAQGRAHA